MAMTDDEMIHCLAGALVSKPGAEQPLRLNLFALDADDALAAARGACGEGAEILELLFRRDLVAQIEATGGKTGFWVSSAAGVEMFIEAQGERQALDLFAAQAGAPAVASVSSVLVAQELDRMQEALDGRDKSTIAGPAFLAKVAAA